MHKCIEPKKGYPTQDGYLRILDRPRKEGGKLKMVHRLEWEKVHGPIPEGHEINHLCKNRRCCNVEHLECLSVSEHRSKDNAERYKDRAKAVVEFSKSYPWATQYEIAEIFGITQGGVSLILKRNRNEN